MSEPRNHSIHCVNPKSLKIISCSISKPQNSAILIQWISESSNTDMARKLMIAQNDIYGAASETAAVLINSASSFSAHNVKIKIESNKIYKSKGDALRVQDLAINNMEICDNEFFQNYKNNLSIIQVHQKSNKFKFLMRNNKFKNSEEGYGAYIRDSGFYIEKSVFIENKECGLYIDSYEKPNSPLQQDIQLFLSKFPMTCIIKDCDFFLNKRNGLQIRDFWKGSVTIIDSKFYENDDCGLNITAFDYPISLSKGGLPPTSKGKSQKSGIPLNKVTVHPYVTNQLKSSSDYLIKKLDDHVLMSKLPDIGHILLKSCDFQDNHNHGVLMNNVFTNVQNCQFLNNFSNYALYLHSEDQKHLLKIEYERDSPKIINGIIGGSWGTVKFLQKRSGICCGPFSKTSDTTNPNSRQTQSLNRINQNDQNTNKCKFF